MAARNTFGVGHRQQNNEERKILRKYRKSFGTASEQEDRRRGPNKTTQQESVLKGSHKTIERERERDRQRESEAFHAMTAIACFNDREQALLLLGGPQSGEINLLRLAARGF